MRAGWRPDLWILAPGVGAQGGDLAAALAGRAARRWPGPAAAGLARHLPRRRPALRLPLTLRDADQCRAQRTQVAARSREPQLASLAAGVSSPPWPTACWRPAACASAQFTLKSGLVSPIYLDLRQPGQLPARCWRRSPRPTCPLLRGAGIRPPGRPALRRPAHRHRHQPAGRLADDLPAQGGQGLRHAAEIEGDFQPGETVVVIDDLATTGGSKFEAIEKLTAAGLQVQDVVVLIDRQSGRSEALAQAGYRLHAVFTLTPAAGLLGADRRRSPASRSPPCARFLEAVASRVSLYSCSAPAALPPGPRAGPPPHPASAAPGRRTAAGARAACGAGSPRPAASPVQAFGLRFSNPVGLAAGYDKDGLGWRGLACLGFGHIEIGTVTPLPQPGNPHAARLSPAGGPGRDQPHGLPGPGRGLRRRASSHGQKRPPGLMLGVNLGKNKDTPNEEAAAGLPALMRRSLRRWPITWRSTSARPTPPGCATCRAKPP